MKTTLALKSLWLSVALGFALMPQAQAQIITNGGFESGLTGWTVADQVGSDGTFFVQSGTASPLNAFPVPAPPEGTQAAMTDAGAGGSHVLYQDFVVPVNVTSASVNFSLFINSGNSFITPANLDWAATNTPGTLNLNQQVRVDILRVGADPFSVAVGDVLQNLYGANPADPLVSGYTSTQRDVTSLLQANAGQTLRLRFAEVDNVSFLNLGVDQVSVSVAVVPEPSSIVLVASASAVLLGIRQVRRRYRKAKLSQKVNAG